jgi:adenylate cyclase
MSLQVEAHYPLRFAYRGETRRDLMRPQSVANIFVQSIWEANYRNGDALKDKIVLIGPTGNLHKDVFNSPFGLIGGPEAHLNVMHALLSRSFLRDTPEWIDLLLVIGGGVLALFAGAVVRNPILRIVLVGAVAVAFFCSAVWVFDHWHFIIQPFSPILSLVGSSFTFVVWQQLIERLEKAKLRRTFERYVSRDVVKELVDNPESYLNTVGGARKTISILFTDVRDFTTMIESGDPQKLVAQLNEYFDQMVAIVFRIAGPWTNSSATP